MKKVTLLAAMVLAPFLFFNLVSCKKNNLINNNNNSISVMDFANMPVVSNGMLVFDDEAHLESYLVYLDSVCKSDTTNPADTFSADAKLDVIEAGLTGFTSLRSSLNASEESFEGNGWGTVEAIPERHFLHGRLFHSVFNSQLNVKVGTAIHHLYSKDVSLVIWDGNSTSLGHANSLPSNLSLEDVKIEFATDQSVTVYNPEYAAVADLTVDYQNKTTADTTWKCKFTFDRHYEPGGGCNPNRKYKVSYVSLEADGVTSTGIYKNGDVLILEINWGDGTVESKFTTVQKVTSTPDYLLWGPSAAYAFEHTYASVGNKSVTVKVRRPYHTTYVAEQTNYFNIPYNECGDFSLTKKTEWAYTLDGKWALRCISRTHQTIYNWSGFIAETDAYEMRNGKYRSSKADRLVAQFWFDWACGSTGSYASATWSNKDKHVECNKFKATIYENVYRYFNSNHKLLYNEQYRSHDMVIVRCP